MDPTAPSMLLLNDNLFPIGRSFPVLLVIKNLLFEVVSDERVCFRSYLCDTLIFRNGFRILENSAEVGCQTVCECLGKVWRGNQAEPDVPGCALDANLF